MMHQALHPPERPDVLPEDETPSEVSDDNLKVVRESDKDKATHLKRIGTGSIVLNTAGKPCNVIKLLSRSMRTNLPAGS